MRVEARGLVYDASTQPSARRVACFTSLCTVRSGTILCGFQVGPAKQSVSSTIALCRSRDGGNTWQELDARFDTTLDGVPGSLAGSDMLEVGPGRLLLVTTWFDRSEPDRPLFDPESEGILHSKVLQAVSEDEGETWSPWSVVATAELSGCATTGPLVAWPDGSMALAFESFKEYDDPRPARHGAWLMVSRDGGSTYGPPLSVARDENDQVYYWDQRLCAAGPEGELVALFWTHDRATKRDLSVHLRSAKVEGDRVVGESAAATPIRGQIAAALVLDEGRLAAFVVDRVRPGTMKLRISSDGGRTWPDADSLVVHTHEEQAAVHSTAGAIDFAEYWEDMIRWSFGHPAMRRLDRDRVLVAFYAGSPDCMSIHWARVHVGRS